MIDADQFQQLQAPSLSSFLQIQKEWILMLIFVEPDAFTQIFVEPDGSICK